MRTIRLNEWQENFIFDKTKYTAYFGEFRNGKSTAAAIKVLRLSDLFKKNRGLIVRNTYRELKDSTILQFLNLYQVRDIDDWNKSDLTLTFGKNGSKIFFRALDRPNSWRSIKNLDLGWFWVEQAEEIEKEVWELLQTRLTLPDIELYGFATGNPEGKGTWPWDVFFFRIHNNQTPPEGIWGLNENYRAYQPPAQLNAPNLPPGYYEDLEATMPKQMADKYLRGSWEGYGGLVYDEFSEENIIEPEDYFDIPEEWAIYEGMDYGVANPTVWLWLAIDDERNVYVYDEHYAEGELPDFHASIVKVKRRGRVPKWTVGCPRAFQRERDGKTPANLYKEKHDISIIPHPVTFDVRWPIVSQYFKQGRLKIFRRCENLIKELEGYKWRTIKSDANHAIEALERAVAKIDSDERKYKLERPLLIRGV